MYEDVPTAIKLEPPAKCKHCGQEYDYSHPIFGPIRFNQMDTPYAYFSALSIHEGYCGPAPFQGFYSSVDRDAS